MNTHSENSEVEKTEGRGARRKARTRAELLAAARMAFAARGYHEASIADITAAADIGVGTFYLHFRDKDEIFTTLIDEGIKEIHEQVMTRVLGHPEEQRLSALIRLTFHYAYAQRDLFRIALTGRGQFSHKFRAEAALVDGITQIFMTTQAYLAEYNIPLLVRFVTGIVRQGIVWWFEYDEPGPEVMTEQVMLLLKQGIPAPLLIEAP